MEYALLNYLVIIFSKLVDYWMENEKAQKRMQIISKGTSMEIKNAVF